VHYIERENVNYIRVGVGGEGRYLLPNVSQFETWLSPGPADPSVAHKEKR